MRPLGGICRLSRAARLRTTTGLSMILRCTTTLLRRGATLRPALGPMLCVPFLLALLAVVGCGSSSTEEPSADEAADADAEAPAEPFVLGDLLDPFEAPPLEEIDANADWQDRPVVDALAELRDAKQDEPALVSVEEALSMKNDSEQANTKILSALSKLAPQDGEGVDFDARIRRALPQDLLTTNPLLSSSMAEQELSSLTAFGLFSFDWKMKPHASADAVVSWQTSADGMMDKVVMRDDLTWSDGQPITAHDIEYSFKVIMTKAVPVPAMRTGMDRLHMVKAYDDHTLIYFHKAAEAANVWNLNFAVIPKHVYEKTIAEDPSLRTSKAHTALELNPVVGGPYRYKEWSRARQIVVERREDYYTHNGEQVREKPYFKEVRFEIIEDVTTRLLALKSARIDEAELGAEQWQTQTDDADFYKNNTKVRGDQWTFFYIGWNLNPDIAPFFAEKEVRRAMAYTMDYEEMTDTLSFGLYPRCHGIFSPDSWMYPKDPPAMFEQDLDKAEDLLDEAGWVDSDGDGVRDKEINGRSVPFDFTLLVSNKPDRIAICNLLKQDLDRIGVRCTVQPLDAATFQQRMQDKNFQAEMAGWGTGTDPYTNKNIFGTGEFRNYGAYSNKLVDELFDKGIEELDQDKRAEIYAQIHEQIWEDQPYLFLYNYSSFYGFNKDLRGYRFSPRGPFHYSPGFSSIWSVAK